MISQWAQSLLQFMLWFAVASIGGCASYALLRLTSRRMSNATGIFTIFLTGCCCVIAPISVLALMMLIAVPSSVAAYFEKARDEERRTWNFHFGFSLLNYLLFILATTVVGIVLGTFSDIGSRVSTAALDDSVSVAGIYAALLLTPASISLFRWIVHNSQLRPGIDRHLEEGEDTTP